MGNRFEGPLGRAPGQGHSHAAEEWVTASDLYVSRPARTVGSESADKSVTCLVSPHGCLTAAPV